MIVGMGKRVPPLESPGELLKRWDPSKGDKGYKKVGMCYYSDHRSG